VKYGLDMMDQLRQSFDEISRHANATNEAVAQIHLMTTQQTTACLQMQDTIGDVADAGKVVEEGADLTEESMRSLKELADILQTLVTAGTETQSES